MNEISIKTVSDDFEKHLEENSRIFFSGAFGIGKTYFLDHFFKENKEYEVIHLFPVNYAVAQNEDIMELIKYDIICTLLNSYSNTDLFNEDEISDEIALTGFILSKGNDIINSFLKGITKISTQVEGFFEIAKGLERLEKINATNYKNYKTQLRNNSGELEKFLLNAQEKIGSIYESNYYSDLIQVFIQRLKRFDKNQIGEEDKKKVVLIVDDLDRIDPEHIFRILNVFAAHFDFHSNSENKFDFDKIIVVGDYSNIKSIYEHKYGIGADSNGYLDKFYSSQPYFIDNRASIQSWIENNVSSYDDNHFLLTILLGLVHSGELTIRQLLRVNPAVNIENRSSEYYLSFHLDILKRFFANTETVNRKIIRIENSFPRGYNGQKDLEMVQHYTDFFVLPPLLKNVSNNQTNLKIPNLNLDIEISTKNRGYSKRFTLKNQEYDKIPFWELVSEAFLSLSK